VVTAKARFSAEPEDRTNRRRAGPLLVVAVVVLAGVAALASRSPLSTAGLSTTTGGGSGAKLPEAWMLAVVIAASAIAVFEVIYGLRGRARMIREGGRRRNRLTLAALVQTFALLLVLALIIRLHHPSNRSNAASAAAHSRVAGHHAHLRPRGTSALSEWVLLGGISALIVVDMVILAVAFVPIRRRASPTGAPETEAALSAVQASLAALKEERDPRRAVIAAYRQMELALSAAGVPRGDSESPREYLDRTIGSLSLHGAPVRTLTELFERARFSLRRIDFSQRDEALAALTALRDELEVRVATPAD
jgi:hypothetical protein